MSQGGWQPTPFLLLYKSKSIRPHMIKFFTFLAILASFVSPAKADTVADHNALWEAVESTGTRVRVNPRDCDGDDNYGWYWARYSELVICQENRVQGDRNQVAWTEEDLDTLRHEAHHLVQDCMDNRLDGRLESVYENPLALAKNTLSRDFAETIVEGYIDKGEHIVIMELEAFSVATINNPLEQVADIKKYCF